MAVHDGIVVIFPQYRLGVLGHLPPPVAPTGGDPNYALRDIVTSLEVVRDNIAAAGGDPAAVTVGGQSAGASMTRALWGTPAAKGLYRGFIMHSDPIVSGARLRPRDTADARRRSARRAPTRPRACSGSCTTTRPGTGRSWRS